MLVKHVVENADQSEKQRERARENEKEKERERKAGFLLLAPVLRYLSYSVG